MSATPAHEMLDPHQPRPDGPDMAMFLQHLARYQFAFERLAGGERILDAGCGAGYGTALLAERGSYALGLDCSPRAIEYAREHYRRPNLNYVVMNAEQMALAVASFDVVISFEVIERFAEPEAFLRECGRVLRPGGRLILSTANQETHDLRLPELEMKDEVPVNQMTGSKLKSALRKHFESVEIYGQRRKGSRIYGALRALDVFNLRLRLLNKQQQERLQQKMGVPVAPAAQAGTWVFSRHQLRQANTFVAVCRKNQ